MNIPVEHWYRLVPRGGAGLVCDNDGLALGAVALARARLDERRVRRCDVRSPDEIGEVLKAAYGRQPDEVVLRLHRGLSRAAKAIEAGELCRAGIEAVMLGVPDLTHGAMAKLPEIADLEKGGMAWQTEPRIPAEHTGGGQWTSDGGGAPLAVKPAGSAGSESALRGPLTSPLDDGVYRPGLDHPSVTPVGGAEEEEEESPRGSPGDLTRLEDVFPGFKTAHTLEIIMTPIDRFLEVGALADGVNEVGTETQWDKLVSQIREIDPSFSDDQLFPPGRVAGLSWEARDNLINNLRMQRALAFYKLRGDAEPLQVETLLFLQKAVNSAYDEGVAAYEAGKLNARVSRQHAIGVYMDGIVRSRLKNLFTDFSIPYGPGGDITINNRDYDTSTPQKTYKLPDARVGDLSYDWTLAPKTISDDQIQGFFNADSKPRGVVIIRPTKIGKTSTYLIPRPPETPSEK
jgi:hypothetical protein